MVNKMYWIFCVSILMSGLFGGNIYVTARECSSPPLSDPTRVVVTPPQSGGNYSIYEPVFLSCNASGEYTFTGNDYSYCEGNNQWDPDPLTVICYEKCADSLIPSDVIQEDSGGTAKSYYEHGEFIYLSCPASQTLIGPSTVPCLDGSIGDATVSCEGGPTTAVYTTKQTTAPSTTVQQDETTLSVQTIINTEMGSTTSHDGSLTTRQTDAMTHVQTEPLTSTDYITTSQVITLETSPTNDYATTALQTTSEGTAFTEISTENNAEATTTATDKPSTISTHFTSTDVYEATTVQTVTVTDVPGRTTSTNPIVTSDTLLNTDYTGKSTTMSTDNPLSPSTLSASTEMFEATDLTTVTAGRTASTEFASTTNTGIVTADTEKATMMDTDNPSSSSTRFIGTDQYEATTFQTVISTDTSESITNTKPSETISTKGATDEATSAFTDKPVTSSTHFVETDTEEVTTFQTVFATDMPTSGNTSGTESSVTYLTQNTTFPTSEIKTVGTELATVSTDVATDGVAPETDPSITVLITEFMTSVFTELPGTDSDYVTTSATDVSVTDDDDVTTSVMEVTELVSTRVTVITEVITEIDEFTTPSDSNVTTIIPDPCEGFCDLNRESCVTGSDGPQCECLPGFYRITEDKSETDVQCTEAILFEVDARITEIDGQAVEFSEDLRNSSSARFNYLEELICNTVDTVQDTLSGFLVCQVTSFSNGSIIAAIELYFDELSNATEADVYNETLAAFGESNITAEVTRVELVVPSLPTTGSTPTQTPTTATEHGTSGRTTHTVKPTESSGTAGFTSKTEFSTTHFVTTAKPAKSTAETTLLVLYILIPILVALLLIAIGFILYQNKKVSAQYGAHNSGGKKPKNSKKPRKGANTSAKETNGHVNKAFYNSITTGEEKSTQTTGLQTMGDDRPASGVVVSEDIEHMVYPYPWNEPGRLEADDDKAIYAKVDRKSMKGNVTHKNPPHIVEIELQAVVVEEPQSPPVDWAAVDPAFDAVEKGTAIPEAVSDNSDLDSGDAVQGHVDDTANEEYEAKNSGSKTEIDGEPDYIAIGGFELNEFSSSHGSASKDDDALNIDAISLELTSTMETEMDKRLNNRSTPC